MDGWMDGWSVGQDVIPMSVLPKTQQGCAVGISGCDLCPISRASVDTCVGRWQETWAMDMNSLITHAGEGPGSLPLGPAWILQEAFTGEYKGALFFPV